MIFHGFIGKSFSMILEYFGENGCISFYNKL